MKKGTPVPGYVIDIVTVLVAIGTSYGVVTTKLKYFERELDEFRKDHDLLVELNTKMDMLLNKKGQK